MIISTFHLLDKLKEYKKVFGENVVLTINSEGGSFDIGIRDVHNGFFMDSFETFEEALSKDPQQTKENATKWGWGWVK